MSRLPDLERSLIAAAARLDGAGDAAAPAPDAPPTGLRARWRRMSRRGHVAGVLVGTLALAGVATGSAQVAGLHPFSSLSRFEKFDSGLKPTGAPDSELQLRAPAGWSSDWLVRAYLARNGHLCSTGGVANEPGGPVDCKATVDIAQALFASRYPGTAVLSPIVTTQGTDRHPREVVISGLVAVGAPKPSVVVDGKAYSPTLASGIIRAHVNRSTEGLPIAGQRLVTTFPPTISLRLFAAQVPAPAGAIGGKLPGQGGVFAGEIAVARSPVGAEIDVMTPDAWNKAHRAQNAQRRRQSRLLDRVPAPVAGISAAVRRAEPAFDRPRTVADVVPAKLIDQNLVATRVRRSASRRLHPVGVSAVGPIWVLPGLMHITASAVTDAVCIAGPAAVRSCQPLLHGRLVGLQAVICSPMLNPQQRLLVGFVPPGVTRARLTFDRGAPQTIAVRDYLAVARRRTDPLIKTVTWLGAGKPKTVDSSFPGDTAADQCAKNKATGLRVLKRIIDQRGGDTEVVTRRP